MFYGGQRDGDTTGFAQLPGPHTTGKDNLPRGNRTISGPNPSDTPPFMQDSIGRHLLKQTRPTHSSALGQRKSCFLGEDLAITGQPDRSLHI